jgi:alkaline phosphatase
MRFLVSALALGLVSGLAPAAAQQGDPTWGRARAELADRLAARPRPVQAKNLILFVVDGMSVDTITAARIYDGQSRNESGVENRLAFDRFPYSGLVRTYDVTQQVPDSAATATAMTTGIKTRTGAVGVYPDQYLDACAAGAEFPVTLAEHAEDRGLSTGVVSTARITHATPATMYAHSISRGFESDADLPDFAVEAGCADIASQLLAFDHGDGLDVVLGGGAASFLPVEEEGRREDGRNLIEEWEEAGGVSVRLAEEFRALDAGDNAPVLGLFSSSHMSFDTDRLSEEEPSLAEMTRFAIERLSRDEDGYVLLVEAGRVDHAHHGTNAFRALTDMQALNAAVATAHEMTGGAEDTLIVVTADHGHVFTISGYPARDEPILGLVRSPNMMQPGLEPGLSLDRNGRPYTTLGYHNGPNPHDQDAPPLTQEQVLDRDYQQQSGIPMGSETHSGADVAVFADGPFAHLFSGSLEQNTLFHLMTHALGWEMQAE